MVVTLGQQYNIGEKPTVILYDHDVDIFNIIQKVQDTVIHLEVDEEQWEVTQGSKRQAERTGFLAQYLSGL